MRGDDEQIAPIADGAPAYRQQAEAPPGKPWEMSFFV
jgi:hypothetical protein